MVPGRASSSELIGEDADGGELTVAEATSGPESALGAKVDRLRRRWLTGMEFAGGSGGGTMTVVITAGRAKDAGGEGMLGGANGGTESPEVEDAKSER